MSKDLHIWAMLLLLLPTMCLLKVSSGLFAPADNYLIDCGSSGNTSVSNRVFVGDASDSYTVSTSQIVSVKTNSTSLSSSVAAYDKDLYQTARVFNETAQFTFSIRKHGRHWIRLYFFPFVSESYDLSSAVFSVSAQNFTLLKDYQQYNGSLVKEYSLSVTSDQLVLTFTPSSDSFAFINALEVVSVPDELIPDQARIIASSNHYQKLHYQALETVARVNMGNISVPSENDTLWRNWVSDDRYLKSINLVTFESNVNLVNYTNASPSEDVAPRSVYGTTTMLNSEKDPTSIANVTWLFEVDPGFQYLVRFHFCDIVSFSAGSLYFNVYMNSLVVYNNLNLANVTSGVVGVPYYIDAIVRIQSNSRMLNVSVGPSTVNNPYPMGILNGLEIMKINSSTSSFYVFVSDTKSSVFSVAIIAALASGVSCIALIVFVVSLLMCKRRKNLAHVGNSQTQGQEGKDANGALLISHTKIGYLYPFAVIQETTDNFNEGLVIGVGGFGKVYKGVLKDETNIAVKRGVPQSKQGLEEFRTEIEMLSQFRHRHLVSLIGYCDEQGEMIIIYEYMKNGSLKNHLYDSNLPSLRWRERLEICIGSARGLHYLHTGTTKAIIHRDVKSANILLDENLMAKVADFGLSKAGPDIDQTHVSTMVKGSFGYLDPEYLTRQQLTEKSDVYSFGVVLFEVICGRPVIDPTLPREMVNLSEWALKWQRKGELAQIIDPRLAGDIKVESLNKFGETAEKCLAMCGVDRPSMGDVLWNLEYALQLQGDDARSSQNGNSSRPNNGKNSNIVISTQSSLGNVGEELDPDLISMSQVFSELVKQK